MLPIVIILITMAIVVSLINVYCVGIIIYSHNIKKTSHMTIFALLLGHAIQGLLVIPCYAAKRSGIYKHTVVCDIFRFSYLFTNYACCLSVLVISADRFIGVQFPLQYKSWVTTKRLSRVLLAVWVYVFLLCLIPFIPSGNSECRYNPQTWWVITMLVCNTLLPFVVIIVCYIVIFKKINMVYRDRDARAVDLLKDKDTIQCEASKRDRGTKAQVKRTKMAFLIVGAYVLCWGPSFIYNVLLTLCHNSCFADDFFNSKTEEILGFVTKLLTFVDGIAAPTIYCVSNATFNKMGGQVANSLREKLNRSTRRFDTRKPVRSTNNTMSTSSCVEERSTLVEAGDGVGDDRADVDVFGDDKADVEETIIHENNV